MIAYMMDNVNSFAMTEVFNDVPPFCFFLTFSHKPTEHKSMYSVSLVVTTKRAASVTRDVMSNKVGFSSNNIINRLPDKDFCLCRDVTIPDFIPKGSIGGA